MRDGYKERSKTAIAFGHAVRHFRADIGISQQGLIERTGLDRSYVSLIECGYRNPTLKTIITIAEALFTEPGRLVDRSMIELQYLEGHVSRPK